MSSDPMMKSSFLLLLLLLRRRRLILFLFRRSHIYISWNFIWTILDALFKMKITFAVWFASCTCVGARIFVLFLMTHTLQAHPYFVVVELNYLLATSFSTLNSTNEMEFNSFWRIKQPIELDNLQGKKLINFFVVVLLVSVLMQIARNQFLHKSKLW